MSGIDLQKILSAPILKCPTCGLRFHGQLVCRRCGTDLSLLMKTAGCALQLRNQARQCFMKEEYSQAMQWIQKAETLQKTNSGRTLLAMIKQALNK